ncbi:ROK family protein [Pseudolysinimonas yzui]|uniref:ROK family protein n=1 Tax=Pseudolysinimonas yzui TaxID=2708254 RepID=UPI00174B4A4B
MPVNTHSWTPTGGATRAVALEVLINGPISRTEIARKLDLSAGSLTRLSTPLIEAGLLVEGEERAEGRAGRRSRPLDVIPGSRAFIGMKVTGDRVIAARTDFRASIQEVASAPLLARDPDSVVADIARLAERLTPAGSEMTGLGVGVGGRVDRRGVVQSAPFLEWENVPLAELVAAATGIRSVVDNDLVAFTEFEHWFGAARSADRFAVITLGAGVGYGLMVGGEVVRNDDAGLGLVGHWPLDPFGALCPVGHRGCARSVLTESAVVAAATGALGRDVSYAEVLDLATAEEPAARRIVDDAGRALGRLIAAVANLTMPELVVLGGEGVRLATVAADAVREGIAGDRDSRASEVRLFVTDGDDAEWCRGAAVVAIQDYVLDRSVVR